MNSQDVLDFGISWNPEFDLLFDVNDCKHPLLSIWVC